MKIVLIAGKAGSGKSSAAMLLKRKLNKAVVTNFSKYIKLFAWEMTAWNLDDQTKPRKFLQMMGDKLRSIDINFLPRRMLEDMAVYKDYYNYVIISDVRLINEINYMKNYSKDEVITIRIDCDDCLRDLTDEEKGHRTEIELDNYQGFDYRITNNHNNDLEKEIDKIVEGLK